MGYHIDIIDIVLFTAIVVMSMMWWNKREKLLEYEKRVQKQATELGEVIAPSSESTEEVEQDESTLAETMDKKANRALFKAALAGITMFFVGLTIIAWSYDIMMLFVPGM